MFDKQKKIDRLVMAARVGDMKEVQRWVKKRVPLDGREDNRGFSQCTALEAALLNKEYEVVEYLVAHGATMTNEALRHAVLSGNSRFLECAVEHNVSLVPFLSDIFNCGHANVISVVVENYGQMGLIKNMMKEALENAAFDGREDVVVGLVENDVEVTKRAVENARANNHADIAELLGLIYDPDDAAVWKEQHKEHYAAREKAREAEAEKQRILAEGTVAEKAQLKVREMEQAANKLCAPDDIEKEKRLAKLRKVVGELEKGLNVLQQSPHVDFAYSAHINEKQEIAIIKTNVQGKIMPLRLEISARHPNAIVTYTGDDMGYKMPVSYDSDHVAFANQYACNFLAVKLLTNEFNDVNEAVNDVIERAFAHNAVKPANANAKPAARKKRGNTP